MNHRTPRIAIAVLLVVLFDLAGQRQAAATTCPQSSAGTITAACTITSSGSYTLGADLQVSTNSNSGCSAFGGVGICISGVNNVTIDMAGHVIKAGGAVVAAIFASGSGGSGVTVKNGIIDSTGTSGYGFTNPVELGNDAHIERLQVVGTTSNYNNYSIGVGDGSTVVDNVIINSGYVGITSGADCVIARNAVNSGVSGATGIQTSTGGLVEENTVMNITTGLSLSSTTGFSENVLAASTAHSGGVSLGDNLCNGSTC